MLYFRQRKAPRLLESGDEASTTQHAAGRACSVILAFCSFAQPSARGGWSLIRFKIRRQLQVRTTGNYLSCSRD